MEFRVRRNTYIYKYEECYSFSIKGRTSNDNLLRLESTHGDCLIQPICSGQSHLEQVTQDHAQSGFEYLQRQRLCNFSGQPAPVFNPLYTVSFFIFFLNKVFPYFTCNLIYFKLCPSPLVLMLCTTKEFNSIFFAPPVKY